MRVHAKPQVNDRTLDEFEHQHLSPGATYLVVGIDDEHFRVVNDRGEPVLYPRYLFDIVDPIVPEDWTRSEEKDGGYFVDPPECAGAGFYEDYFDGRPDAIATFKDVLRRLMV